MLRRCYKPVRSTGNRALPTIAKRAGGRSPPHVRTHADATRTRDRVTTASSALSRCSPRRRTYLGPPASHGPPATARCRYVRSPLRGKELPYPDSATEQMPSADATTVRQLQQFARTSLSAIRGRAYRKAEATKAGRGDRGGGTKPLYALQKAGCGSSFGTHAASTTTRRRVRAQQSLAACPGTALAFYLDWTQTKLLAIHAFQQQGFTGSHWQGPILSHPRGHITVPVGPSLHPTGIQCRATTARYASCHNLPPQHKLARP